MQRKNKINLEKARASLFTACPHCQYAIPPNETQRVSFTEMKCPSADGHLTRNRNRARRVWPVVEVCFPIPGTANERGRCDGGASKGGGRSSPSHSSFEKGATGGGRCGGEGMARKGSDPPSATQPREATYSLIPLSPNALRDFGCPRWGRLLMRSPAVRSSASEIPGRSSLPLL